MDIDQEYLKGLLTAFQKSEKPTTDIRALQKCGYDYDEDRFYFHLKILHDKGLIEPETGFHLGYDKSADGHVMWSVIPLRLTVKGHDFLKNGGLPSPMITQNIINAGTINSPIQQGGAHAVMTQAVNYTQESDNLRQLVETFENHIGDLPLNALSKQKAKAQIATIKAQLEDEPDPIIIKQAGRTLRNLTEGVIGNFIATATQPTVWHWVQSFMAIFQ
jgi:hypothetical protein